MFQKFKALSRLKKIGLVVMAFFVIGIANAAAHPQTNTQPAQNVPQVLGTQTTKASPQKKEPVITTKTEIETQPIPFTSTTVNDSKLLKGTSKITVKGVDGVSTLTYKVTYSDDVQIKKELVSQETTTPSVTQVTAIGTYVAPQPVATTPPTTSSCDPNYTGACVPNVYPDDVDCGGGSGNGPYYVYGTVHVVGVDHYGLDRDHDGIACE